MSQAKRKAPGRCNKWLMARKGEVGRSSNLVPTKRKIGGLEPIKVPSLTSAGS